MSSYAPADADGPAAAPVISAKMSGLQPFMPIPRNRSASGRSLRTAASRDSMRDLAGGLSPGPSPMPDYAATPRMRSGDASPMMRAAFGADEAQTPSSSSAMSRRGLEALGVFESPEDLPVPIPVATGGRTSGPSALASRGSQRGAPVVQPKRSQAQLAPSRPATRSRANLKDASPLKVALSSSTTARVAPSAPSSSAAVPFHLSPSKVASPKVSAQPAAAARPASPTRGRYVFNDGADYRSSTGGPSRPASPSVTSTASKAAGVIRAKVTSGVSPSKGMTPRGTGTGVAGRPPSPLKESTRQGLGMSNAEARESVVYDFDDSDVGESSFVFDAPPEEHAHGGASGSGGMGGATPGRSASAATADGTDDGGEQQETVMVHVRLRPPKASEECAWDAHPHSAAITLIPAVAATRTQREAGLPHHFDGVHAGSSNGALYADVARPLVRAALAGYDAVVFAYGQTASGKTFTLSGDEHGAEAGIIPRAVRDVFRGIQQSESTREYLLRVSYLEIWNESVKDLLDPTNVPQVRDDRRNGRTKGTVVRPLREEIVTSAAAVRDLLRRGQVNRHVGETDWNERSSRSHTCFKMTIESWQRHAGDAPDASPSKGGGRKVRISELSLIDLAGSERYVSQGADRRAEGAHINKSLLTLGKVILALSESSAARSVSGSSSGSGPGSSSAQQHIPFRDSKLTRILQNSLSGNARVAVICTLNPSPSAVDESLSTLSFAHRVKKVAIHARRREIQEFGGGAAGGAMGQEAQALLMRYKLEAEALRGQVALMQSGDERLQEVQRRLDLLENLKVRGGSGRRVEKAELDSDISDAEDEMHIPARPVSPVKAGSGSAFDFDEPPHILREKLFNAEERIAELEEELSNRPHIPSDALEQDGHLRVIADLQRKVQELELVCEAQAIDAPPKVREDVQREYQGKIDDLEKKLAQREQFIALLARECDELRSAKKQLWKLAHGKTADILSTIHSPTSSPRLRVEQPPRPASVVGTIRVDPPSASGSPLLRRALAEQQLRGTKRQPPSPLQGAAPDSPSLGAGRKRGRRSHSFSALDSMQAMDKIAAMADTMLADESIGAIYA